MLHKEKFSIYRFHSAPAPNLPLSVRSAGSYRLRLDSRLEKPLTKWFCEVFWCESGAGEFRLGKQTHKVEAGEVFYLLPGESHDLRPRVEPWVYHWFTLDHKQSAVWLQAFGFDERPIPATAFPEKTFTALCHCVKEGTTRGDRQAAHLAHAMLLAATDYRDGAFVGRLPIRVVQCRQYIDAHYADPNLNINLLATKMGLHRTSLFRAFRQAYQITPSTYLQNKRIHQAMELLKEGKLSIQDVALESGIPDANYLTKLIRRKSGVSARAFRANYSKARM
jgi:AraC-like DNA-binding protein